MTKPYKLPRCFIGQKIEGGGVVTEEMCNPNCHCKTPVEAMFCMEGHMTECHAGMTCDQAECSHLERYEDAWPDDQAFVDHTLMSGDDLMAACAREMGKFNQIHGVIQFGTQISVLMAMISAMQLALRHPGFPPSTRKDVESVIAEISNGLQDYPALVEIIRRGGLKEQSASVSDDGTDGRISC